MNSFVKVLAVVNLLGAAQGILLAAALLTIKRGNRTANRLLAAFIFVMAVLVSGALVFTTRHVLAYPHLSYLHHPLLYLIRIWLGFMPKSRPFWAAVRKSRLLFSSLDRGDTNLFGGVTNFLLPAVNEVWQPKDLGDEFRKPVKSNRPALFISGTLDANTPPHRAAVFTDDCESLSLEALRSQVSTNQPACDILPPKFSS